jgi:lipopolysaccharide exporter
MTAAPGTFKERAVRSFVWSAVAFGGSRLGVFITTLVLARLLAPDAFGIVAAGLVLVSVLELGLDLGVGAALIYEQGRGVTERVRAAFTLNLLACVALTAVGIAFAPAVASVFDASAHTAVFQAIFLFLLVRGAGQVHDAVLKRDLRFARRTGIEISRAVVRAAVSIPLALAGFGVWALVWGLLASEAAGTVLNWVAVRLRPALRLSWVVARPLLGFGVAVVTLNRPEVLNAFREQTLDDLMHALRGTREDPTIAADVVTGEGGRAYRLRCGVLPRAPRGIRRVENVPSNRPGERTRPPCPRQGAGTRSR